MSELYYNEVALQGKIPKLHILIANYNDLLNKFSRFQTLAQACFYQNSIEIAKEIIHVSIRKRYLIGNKYTLPQI